MLLLFMHISDWSLGLTVLDSDVISLLVYRIVWIRDCSCDYHWEDFLTNWEKLFGFGRILLVHWTIDCIIPWDYYNVSSTLSIYHIKYFKCTCSPWHHMIS
jgi:hypothetical protein